MPHKCDCGYETKFITNLKVHKLNYHAEKEVREKEYRFYCKCCDFGHFNEGTFEKHLQSQKHLKKVSCSERFGLQKLYEQ
jgi:hypothetical protein